MLTFVEVFLSMLLKTLISILPLILLTAFTLHPQEMQATSLIQIPPVDLIIQSYMIAPIIIKLNIKSYFALFLLNSLFWMAASIAFDKAFSKFKNKKIYSMLSYIIFFNMICLACVSFFIEKYENGYFHYHVNSGWYLYSRK